MAQTENIIPTPATEPESGESKFDFKQFGRFILKKWWWFAISIFVIVGITAIFLKKTNLTTTTYASVMFNQNEEDSPGPTGTLGALMASFSLGSGNGVNVVDEIYRMQSHSAIKRLVKELDLNRNYQGSISPFRKDIIYFQNSPIEIELTTGTLDTLSEDTKFVLDIKEKGKNLHLKITQGTYKKVFDSSIPQLPYTVKTPCGSFTLTPTSFYRPESDLTFTALLSGLDNAAGDLFKNIDVFLAVKKSNAVTVKIEDKNQKRARAMANTLIELYNEASVADRSAQNKATLDFLNERLMRLYGDLENSGSGIASYKEAHQLVDAQAEAEYIMKMKTAANEALVENETQLGILQMLHDFLTNDANKLTLIPITAIPGTSNEGTNQAINSYNQLVLELMKLQTSAKGNNAVMRQMEDQIDALRANMVSGIDRSIAASRIAIARMKTENGNVDHRISTIPRMEQELTNMMRDNEIKNRIYAYLLQKREEAEVKVARTMPTGVIIDEAWTDQDSATPNKIMVLAGVFLVALIIPLLIAFSKFQLRQRRKEDNSATPTEGEYEVEETSK